MVTVTGHHFLFGGTMKMKALIEVATEPASQVITTDEAKAYLRVVGASENSMIDGLIGAATRSLEAYLGIKFIQQTLDIWFDSFPTKYNEIWFDGVREMPVSALSSQVNVIELPIGNVKSFTHFKTFSDSGETLHSLSDYTTDTIRFNARIATKSVWPSSDLRALNAVNFRVVAGWPNANSVPADIKQAVKEYVAHMYENRGDQEKMEIPPHIIQLIQHRKRYRVG